MDNCVFCKIIAGELPSKKVYEDDVCLAFLDNSPLAPVHILIVPKEHIASLGELEQSHRETAGHILTVAAEIAKDQGFSDAFRLVSNCGASAGQTVDHLHFHILSGKRLGSFN